MKTPIYFTAVAPLVLLGCASVDPGEASATHTGGISAALQGDKVDLCHVDDDGVFHVINVSTNAEAAHLAHGDHHPGSYYPDGDGDGYGDPDAEASPCRADGLVDNGNDCDDGDANNFPGNEEVCGDGADNDCDAIIDEDCVPDNCVGGSYGGHSYLVCQGSLNFHGAQTACADEGLALSHIDTQAENTWVVDLALGAYGCTTFWETSYWVSNLKSEAGTYWPSADPIWAGGEPNGDGNNVHLIRYCSQPYGWNDVPTSYTWGWVCESAD